MTATRKEKTYTSYEGSYIAIELKKLDTYLADLLKKERDKEAATLLSNIKETLELYSWLMGFFDKGEVPGVVGIGRISARVIGMRSKLMSLVETIKDFRSSITRVSPEIKDSPVANVIYLVSMQFVDIIGRSPKTLDEFLPFLNLDSIMNEAESYGNLLGLNPAQDPTSNPVQATDKSVSPVDEDLRKLFPSFFGFLNAVQQLANADKKEKISLGPKVMRSGFDLYFPIIGRLFSILPIVENHRRIQSGHVTQEMKDDLKRSIDQTDQEIVRLDEEIDIYSHDWKKNQSIIDKANRNKSLTSFYKFVLLVQLKNAEQPGVMVEGHLNPPQPKLDESIRYPAVEDSEIYKEIITLKKYLESINNAHDNDVDSKDFGKLKDIIPGMTDILDCAVELMLLFDKGRTPTVTECLRAFFLCNKIQSHLATITQQISNFAVSRHQPLDMQTDVYLTLIQIADKLASLLPKKINDLAPFANIDAMIAPFATDGLTKEKLQGLIDYAFIYRKYMPNMDNLASMLKEFEQLNSLATDVNEMSANQLIDLSRKFNKLILSVNNFIKFFEPKIVEEFKNCVEVYTGKYIQFKFLSIMAEKIKSKAETTLNSIRAAQTNKKSIYDAASAQLLMELKVESEKLSVDSTKCKEYIDQLTLQINALNTQHHETNATLENLKTFIANFNCIVEMHKKDLLSTDADIERDLNKFSPVTELYQIIGVHPYTQWKDGESSPILRRTVTHEKTRLAALAYSCQLKLSQLDQELNAAIAKKLELDDSLAVVSKNMEPLIEAAENTMEPVEKIDARSPLEFSSPCGIIDADIEMKKTVQFEQSVAWKELFQRYIDDRNEAFFWRDLISLAFAAVIRFFGNTSYEPEYEKRMTYAETMNKSLDTYANNGNAKPLTNTIKSGITYFKPRADENSPLFGWAMKSHLQVIEKELTACSKP